MTTFTLPHSYSFHPFRVCFLPQFLSFDLPAAGRERSKWPQSAKVGESRGLCTKFIRGSGWVSFHSAIKWARKGDLTRSTNYYWQEKKTWNTRYFKRLESGIKKWIQMRWNNILCEEHLWKSLKTFRLKISLSKKFLYIISLKCTFKSGVTLNFPHSEDLASEACPSSVPSEPGRWHPQNLWHVRGIQTNHSGKKSFPLRAKRTPLRIPKSNGLFESPTKSKRVLFPSCESQCGQIWVMCLCMRVKLSQSDHRRVMDLNWGWLSIGPRDGAGWRPEGHPWHQFRRHHGCIQRGRRLKTLFWTVGFCGTCMCRVFITSRYLAQLKNIIKSIKNISQVPEWSSGLGR